MIMGSNKERESKSESKRGRPNNIFEQTKEEEKTELFVNLAGCARKIRQILLLRILWDTGIKPGTTVYVIEHSTPLPSPLHEGNKF